MTFSAHQSRTRAGGACGNSAVHWGKCVKGGDGGVPDGGARDAERVDSRVADAAGAPDVGVDQAVSDSVVVRPGTWVTIPAGTFMMGSPERVCRRACASTLWPARLRLEVTTDDQAHQRGGLRDC